MNISEEQNTALVAKAVEGDKAALETLLSGVQDLVFNLSLRMLGTVPDAEDAAQDILVRLMTRLASFKGESAFSTWVYRVAVNYLIDYKKSMFAARPLSFEFYGADIRGADLAPADAAVDDADAEELKLSCTNVLLQCLDPQTRCIFILGTMFKVDSRTASEALGLTPEAYRQRLSRARKTVAAFLSEHCGLAGGVCACRRRVGYAVSQGRVDPKDRKFERLEALDSAVLHDVKDEMERLDALSLTYESFPAYRAPQAVGAFVRKLLDSRPMTAVTEAKA